MNDQRRPGPVLEPASLIEDPDQQDGSDRAAPDQKDILSHIPHLEPPPSSPWFSVLWLLLACVAFWGIGSATLNLVELWQRHTVIAVPMALAGAALIILLGRAMWLEWLAMRDVDTLSERRKAVAMAIERKDIDALRTALEPTLSGLKADKADLIDEFERAVVDHEDCGDYLRTFENLVLYPLDQEAREVVKKGSIATGAAVAIVPHPALDAAVVLWRTLVMTRQIGAIYGLRPGGLSSWRLFSHAIKSALLAAGIETLTSIVADTATDAIARALKPATEALVIGFRVHRFGQLAIGICRPVAKRSD